jgi:hypothetical protein
MSWNGDTRVLTPKEKQIDHFFQFYLDDTVKGIGTHFGLVFNLHTYLEKHRNVKPALLAKRITLNGKPIFTEKELTRYLKRSGQKKQKKQSGGAGTDVYDKIFARIGAAMSGAGSGSGTTGPINLGKCLPGINLGIVGDILDKMFFAMYHLEQIPVIGKLLIAPAFDFVTLGLPASAELLEKGIHLGLSIAPVPGIVGEMAGTIAECVLSFVATCLNISRKQFGSAFKTSLGIIPFAGEVLETSAQQLEIGLGRYMQRRDAMINPVRPYSPTLGKLGNAYLPSLEIPTEPAPSLSMETVNKVKEELQEAVQEEAQKNPQIRQALDALQKVKKTVTEVLPGVLPKDIMQKLEAHDIPGAASLVVQKTTNLVGNLSNPTALLNRAKNAATNAATKASSAVTNAVEKQVNKATSAVTNAAKNATNKVGFKPTTIRKKRVNYRRQTRRR